MLCLCVQILYYQLCDKNGSICFSQWVTAFVSVFCAIFKPVESLQVSAGALSGLKVRYLYQPVYSVGIIYLCRLC